MLVDIANNGEEAMELANTNDYPLIMMDIEMPVMNGNAATRLIRKMEKYKHTPIIGNFKRKIYLTFTSVHRTCSDTR